MWSAPATSDVLQEFTPAEQAVLERVQGATTTLAAILARVVAKVRGDILAGGYELDADTTKIPLSLHDDAIAIVRWKWLASLPNTQLATKPREKLHDDAIAKLKQIGSGEYAVESPTAGTASRAGTWNSENKIVPRAHPVPRPGVQTSSTDDYANPAGPEDET